MQGHAGLCTEEKKNRSYVMLFSGKSVSSNYTLLAATELMNNHFNSIQRSFIDTNMFTFYDQSYKGEVKETYYK